MPNLILDLMVDRVDLVDEGANSAAFIKLYKRKEGVNNMDLFDEIIAKLKPEHAEVVKAEIAKAKSEVPAEVADDLAKAKEEVTKLTQDLEVAKAACAAAEEAMAGKATGEETEDEDVMKSLDPKVQEIFKSLKAEKEAAEAIVKSINEKKIEDEAIAKAKELKALPVEEAKLVAVMKGCSPEVFEILKAASAVIENSDAFIEAGVSKGNSGNMDAWTKIEKKADDISKANKSLTKAQSIAKAIKENPDLYREYLNSVENGGTI